VYWLSPLAYVFISVKGIYIYNLYYRTRIYTNNHVLFHITYRGELGGMSVCERERGSEKMKNIILISVNINLLP